MRTIKNIAILVIAFIISFNSVIASVSSETIVYDGKDKNSARSVNRHARNNYREHLKQKKIKKLKLNKQKPAKHNKKNSCSGY